MITVVIAGYAVLMLTIVLAFAASAGRPTPKLSDDVVLDARAVRRTAKPVFTPMPTANNGGTEVLAFEA
jgi:hypothetical protein